MRGPNVYMGDGQPGIFESTGNDIARSRKCHRWFRARRCRCIRCLSSNSAITALGLQAVNHGMRMPGCPGRRSTKADSTAASASTSPAGTRALERALPHDGAGVGITGSCRFLLPVRPQHRQTFQVQVHQY